MKKVKFNKKFYWGTATSGPQSEGFYNKPNDSNWDHWFKEEPERFFNQVGPELTSNVYEKYPTDIALMKKLNLNSIRTSIQWTRIIDDLETSSINQEGINFYKRYFQELKDNNIELFINLFHFDMPYELQKIGGFENKKVIDLYAKFAKICFEQFGEYADKWFTFNEPVVTVHAGYLADYHLPQVNDLKRAITVGFNTIVAHTRAVAEFKKVFKKDKNKQIGIILNLTPTYPASDSKEDIEASKFCDAIFNKFWLDSTIKGTFPKLLVDELTKYNLLPEYTKEDLALIKENKITIVGVNYYAPSRAKAPSKKMDKPTDLSFWFESYQMPNARMNIYRGWEIFPDAIYDIALNLKDNYGNIEWFISENGMGVENEARFRNEQGFIEDDYRIDFIKEHLYYLAKAIDEGANCKGYHLWTLVDNWSWLNAYKNRYGYIELDLPTQERKIKKSGEFIAKVAKSGEFDFEFKK
ncbi:glycoside hydrolase family 1 protein [Spiroplasma endosymbiont of Anurida maritima]|uniref:glycoside hydrolase family 1 protein n=1 Tax=Spiroplasma endosymbiont of Anurida maritima TaxID=2967972 RepID=UPI0036D27286